MRARVCIISAGLIGLVPGGVSTRAEAAVDRGQTDQNQPLVLRLNPSGGHLRATVLLNCRVTSSEDGAPVRHEFVVQRVATPLRVAAGRLEGRFRRRRHRHPAEVYGLQDRRSSMLTTASGRTRGRQAAGTIRVRLTAREVRTDTEVGPIPYRLLSQCDSGVRRWRTSRIEFFGPWRPTGPLMAPIDSGTPVVLHDGRVLLTGDIDRPQLYEPRRNRWKRAQAPPLGRRFWATSTVLDDGRVMLAGGILQNRNAKPAVAAVELYEPRSNRWSAAERMHARRVGATSVLLRDGRVLVAGGGDGTGRLNTTAEVYDPGTDNWAFVAPMPIGTPGGGTPGLFSAVLDSGKVLAVGGRSEERYATSSVFDPATDTWTESEVVSGTDYLDDLSAATQLRDGRVLAITTCGYSGGRGKTAIYGALGWAAARRPPFCAFGPSAISALPSGRALLVSTRRAAIYDPAADRWTIAPPYRFPYGHVYGYSPMRVVPAPEGALLVSEGLNAFSSAELFFDS